MAFINKTYNITSMKWFYVTMKEFTIKSYSLLFAESSFPPRQSVSRSVSQSVSQSVNSKYFCWRGILQVTHTRHCNLDSPAPGWQAGKCSLQLHSPISGVPTFYPLGTLRPIYRTGVKLPSRCPILYLFNKYPYSIF